VVRKHQVASKKILILVKLYLDESYNSTIAEEILEVNKSTLTDWTNFCREICTNYVNQEKVKIGGDNVVVEVDEAKFGRRKNHKGRIIDGTWIFGGVEVKDKSKCFFVPVENRSSSTLLAQIKDWIEPGSVIVSDRWKAYNCLGREDYNHLTVNHKYNFVDPDTGAHTNNIEREWREVRKCVQTMGTKVFYSSHFDRVMFIRKFKSMGDRCHAFWLHVGKMYNDNQIKEY